MKTNNQQLSLNWPEGVPLPTIEETKEAVRKAEEMLVDELKELRKKIPPGPTEEMLRTIVF